MGLVKHILAVVGLQAVLPVQLPADLAAGYPKQYVRKPPDDSFGVEPVAQAMVQVCKPVRLAVQTSVLPVSCSGVPRG